MESKHLTVNQRRIPPSIQGRDCMSLLLYLYVMIFKLSPTLRMDLAYTFQLNKFLTAQKVVNKIFVIRFMGEVWTGL